MIFVTVGTALPFDRLVAVADELARHEDVLVQCGDTSLAPRRATAVSFLGYDEVARRMREARVVVAHAGAGSVLTALVNGRRPVVVPRRRALGEAVDDHQVDFARRLAGIGLVHVVDDPLDLPGVVAKAGGAAGRASISGSPLVADLGAYLTASVARAQPR